MSVRVARLQNKISPGKVSHSKSAVPTRDRSKWSDADERKGAQMTTKERKGKFAKERKRAQKGAKERLCVKFANNQV